MTAVQQIASPFTQAGLVKMEERKRPSSFDQGEHGPPAKKLATSANGAGKSHPDTDMPWKDDLEVRTDRRFRGSPTNPTFLCRLHFDANSVVTYSASKKMRFNAKCKSTSARKMTWNVDSMSCRRGQDTMTTISESLTYGFNR